ncbi:MAG: c-type cytochrome domain-containing protein [Vicingaceae bacterium]
MKKHGIIMTIGCLLALYACKHEPIVPEEDTTVTPLPPVITDNSCDPDTVYFQVDVLPFLRSNCAFSGCHGDGSSQNGVELSNYANIMATADVRPEDPEGSDLYEMITETDPDKRMPPPPYDALDSSQIAMIRKWIEQGAKNNSCDNCDTTNVTFSKNVQPIIQNNCQGCHSGSNPPLGILLTNYSEINTRVQSGELLAVIKHEAPYTPMPYQLPKLNQCLIDQIEIWIDNGANND